MRSVPTWADAVPERDGKKNTVWDVAFKPDGTQLVAAVGDRVLVYDANDGDLLHSLKGHKDTVYTVVYSKDGKRFASGGADNTIFIWTSEAEGLLKYSHNDAIQKLAYNPVTQQLASCTATDFGLWSPEQKSVQKHKVPSKILCASWTNDGQFIALGMFNGSIAIFDKLGVEKVSIRREAPVWSLCWNPSRDEPFDLLAVGCWDQTLSFYQLSGVQHGKDRRLGFDPCTVTYCNGGDYLLVGGSDKKLTLMTREGVKLTEVCTKEDWVWSAAARPNQNYVAVACNDGSISMYQLVFSTVHGLYQDRYAYRDTMTDVIVQHLITEQKVRIKCRDYVKKIAVYRDRLAVQLPDRVHIYELAHDDVYDMHYRVKEKLHEKLECNLLVVTSQHVILCQEKKLQLYNFQGRKEREWVLEAVIRYIKVVGGPPGQEGLLVGLKSGTVLKIFVDNPFPIELIRQRASIRCLDLSASRKKLAVVDENANCLVYDLESKELLFTESNANSVAWNTEMEDMLCFSGNGSLSIKTGTFPIHQQMLQGFVVGFNGSKIFCLHYVAMQTIDVPQSASLYRYLDTRDWETAYHVACLGVTESDWRLLAVAALQAMRLDIARKAFIRVRDMRYIELLNSIEQQRKAGSGSDAQFMAEIMAYQGKYQEAAKLFTKAGVVERAIDMFTDLGLWEEAKRFASESGSMDLKDLMGKQAEYCVVSGDYKNAATMFRACGQFARAAAILGERGWMPELMELVREVDASEKEALTTAAEFIRKDGNADNAKEVFMKLDDINSLMEVYVDAHMWTESFQLAEAHPGKFKDDVFLPYAEWLAIEDRFEEAQEAYEKVGRLDLAAKILQQLTHNAVVERRYKDAGFYYWRLAQEHLKMSTSETAPMPRDAALAAYTKYSFKAEVYFAYDTVFQFVEAPFTASMPEGLFHSAQFLLNTLNALGELPFHVSMVYILYTLAKQGSILGAFKVARFAYDRLGTLRIPAAWTDQVDLAVMTIQSKPFSDKEELLPVCYRCSSPNPILNNGTTGDVCVNCGHPFIRSFASMDPLPLVQFFLEDGITDDQAAELLAVEPSAKAGPSDGWRESGGGGGAEMLSMAGDTGPTEDLFDRLLSAEDVVTADEPLRVGEDVLRSLRGSEVFVRKYANGALPTQYFKHMIPDLAIGLCCNCNKFFHQEDLEFEVLKVGHCPFCRASEDAVGMV